MQQATDNNESGILGYAITQNIDKPTNFSTSAETSWTGDSTYGTGDHYVWVKDKAGNISNYMKLKVREYFANNGSINGTTNSYSNPIIPKGFRPVEHVTKEKRTRLG